MGFSKPISSGALNYLLSEDLKYSKFTPEHISGLKLWLRADLGITLNGSNVSSWADQSGNGNNVAQAASGNQPAFNASNASLGNYPSVDFNSPRYLAGTITTINQPLTIFGVGKAGASTGAEQMMLDTDAGERMVGCSATGAVQTYFGIQLIGIGQVSNPCVIGAQVNGASSNLYFNAKTPTVTGSAGAGSSTLLNVGSYSGAPTTSQFNWGGAISELVLYNRIITTPEKDALILYFGSRYGIAIGA